MKGRHWISNSRYHHLQLQDKNTNLSGQKSEYHNEASIIGMSATTANCVPWQ